MFGNLKIGVKMAVSFAVIALFVLVSSVTGYLNMEKITRSVINIGEEKAPLMNAALEMQLSMAQTRKSLEEYYSATSAISNIDKEKSVQVAKDFARETEQFDLFAGAIVKGGETRIGKVVATDNAELAGLVEQADAFHNKELQPAAKDMMEARVELMAQKNLRDVQMGKMESHFETILNMAVDFENATKDFKDIQGTSAEARDRITTWGDMAMEMKTTLALSRIKLEEIVQQDQLAQVPALEKEYQETLHEFDTWVDALLHGAETVEGTIARVDHEVLRKQAEAIDRMHNEAFQVEGLALITSQKALITTNLKAEKAMKAVHHAAEEASALLKKVEAEVSGEIEQAMTLAHETSASASNILFFVSILAVAVCVLCGVVLTRAIMNPIAKILKMIKGLGAGDMDSRINLDQQDELGEIAREVDSFAESLKSEVVAAFQKLSEGDFTFEVSGTISAPLKNTNDMLNKVMEEINVTGGQVATGTSQVSDSSQSLSQGTTEQASSLEEITSSMNELAAQTKQNAENATLANQLTSQSRAAADKGNEQMKDMVTAMNDITESGKNISKIIKVIDEIAFQTNLLALNAAVEAARAGKHGKGFAVVAEEVRNLAARSSKAAEETAKLIKGSVAKTEHGANLANKTADALTEIVSGITRATDLVGEIATASNEQAQGIGQINQGLGQIDKVTQESTASAEELASAAEVLSGQATHLNHMLERFKLRNHEGGHPAQSSRAQSENPVPEAGPDSGSWGTSDMRQVPAPTTFAGAEDHSWGNSNGQANIPEIPVGNAKKVIALDDDEFGKY